MVDTGSPYRSLATRRRLADTPIPYSNLYFRLEYKYFVHHSGHRFRRDRCRQMLDQAWISMRFMTVKERSKLV
jgi:hypothetical protein